MNIRRIALIAVVLVAACREDPGDADYSSLENIRPQDNRVFLEGATPFVEGVRRLNLGHFYEGEATENVLPGNGVDIFFFRFDDQNDGTGNFTVLQEQSRDRVEGFLSDVFVYNENDNNFWGAGIFWYATRDVSRYSTLNISLKSSDPTFAEVTLAMASGPPRVEDEDPGVLTDHTVTASTYGYSNDGEWHVLTIPLQDFTDNGIDLTSIRIALQLGGGVGISGDELLVDDLYMQ